MLGSLVSDVALMVSVVVSVFGSLVSDVTLMVSEWSVCLVHWSVMLL